MTNWSMIDSGTFEKKEKIFIDNEFKLWHRGTDMRKLFSLWKVLERGNILMCTIVSRKEMKSFTKAFLKETMEIILI